MKVVRFAISESKDKIYPDYVMKQLFAKRFLSRNVKVEKVE